MTDKENNDHTKEENYDPDRRRFIKNTGLLAGGVVGGSLLGGFFTNQYQTKPATEEKGAILQEARVFFSREEDFNTLSAATERIFPANDNGPGAIELGVPYFIDKQLNGHWGSNAYAYMSGPFIQSAYVREYEQKDTDQSKTGPDSIVMPSIPSPRYQTRLNRGEVFLVGLRKLREESIDRFDEPFDKIDPEQQDDILQDFEDEKVDIPGVTTEAFFNLLVQTTLEGAYADPVYGGNKNMDGWRMKEYPGPRSAYIGDIESEEFIKMEPKSLKDYQS